MLLFLCLFATNIKAQYSIYTNTDFSMNNFTNWTGCYCATSSANCYTPIMNVGTLTTGCTLLATPPTINCGTTGFLTNSTPAQPSLHTILTNASVNYPNASSPSGTGLFDSLTNYMLRKIPYGINQVARLNSWMYNYQTSQLKYKLVVDTNLSSTFTVCFATVLENPNHGCEDQPYFQIRLLDSNNAPINNSAAIYTVAAGVSPANTCTALGHTISWTDWKAVNFNLKPYHGSKISIQMVAADCGQSGHFGYAYFYAYNNQPKKIIQKYCQGDTYAVLTAPNGYLYKWLPGGFTTQTLTLTNPFLFTVYTCILQNPVDNTDIDTISTVINYSTVQAHFQYSNPCVNAPVQFTNTSVTNNPFHAWSWNFGDSTSNNNTAYMGTTVSHTYNALGTYTVKLTDTAVGGCGDVISQNVTILEKPSLYLKYFDTVCYGDTAVLNVLSPTINSYTWSDGFAGNPHKVVLPMGAWVYKVTAIGSNGCVDSTQTTIIIQPKPSVNFYSDTTFGCDPLITRLINYTIPPNCNYLWDFGDGTTSTEVNPYHIYQTGVYSISLTASYGEKCISTETAPNAIVVVPSPKAEFSISPTIVPSYSPVQFTDLTTQANPQYSYMWDFGDNSIINFYQNPVYSYSSTGLFNVNMNVTTEYGCSSSVSHTILVFDNSNPIKVFMDNEAQILYLSNFADNAEITIYDMTGRRIFMQTATANLGVDMSHFAKGIYNIYVKDAYRTIYKKIIKEL